MASAVRQALLDHSQKKLEPLGVMRALAHHDDWHVPLHAVAAPPADGHIVYAEKPAVAQHQLNVFTDREAADLAAKKFGGPPMGTYVARVSGVVLFDQLQKLPALSNVLMLQVNPGSAMDEQWFVERSAFGLCEAWANALVLERTIAATGAGWAKAMRQYGAWLAVLGKSDNALVRINMREKGEHALIFTAPDLADHFLKGLPNNGGAACKTSSVPGEQLFKFLGGAGVKGFIVNANSAQTRVFDAEAAKAILAAA
jgi:hypothetical protein